MRTERPSTHEPASASTGARGGLRRWTPSILASLLLAANSLASANNNSFCVPPPYSVFNLAGPPNWLTATNPDSSVNIWDGLHGNDWFNDPRWTGALSLGYGQGSANDLTVRAVVDGSPPVLYLSYNVRAMPAVSSSSTPGVLYVGLFPEDQATGGPSQTGTVLQITLDATTTCTGACPPDQSLGLGNSSNAYAPPVNSSSPYAAVVAYTESSANTWAQSSPPWLASVIANARVSKLPTNPFTWNVALRIPIDVTGATGPNLLPGGASKFLYWHDVEVLANTVIPYTWPRATATYEYNTNVAATSGPPDPFATATSPWGELQVQSINPVCTPHGVSFSNYLQIGSNNIPTATDPFPASDELRADGANVFFARPDNHYGSPIPKGSLKATFRIADWGSVYDATAPWTTLPNLQDVPTQSNIATGATIDLEPPLAATGLDLTNPVVGSPAWKLSCDFIGQRNDGIHNTCPPAATKAADNCMLVTLGGAIDSDNNSIRRNMSVVHASSFERKAQINIVGLPPLGTAPRDMYVFVERQNMPAFPAFGQGMSTLPATAPTLPVVPDPVKDGNGGDNGPGIRAKGAAGAASGPDRATSLDASVQLINEMPSMIVHVYHSTGRTQKYNGVTYPVSEPQDSFGYLVQHTGQFFGWESAIEAAPGSTLTQLAPDLFKMGVPENSRAFINTRISTVDWTTWWIWLLLILILLILWLILRLLRRVFGS